MGGRFKSLGSITLSFLCSSFLSLFFSFLHSFFESYTFLVCVIFFGGVLVILPCGVSELQVAIEQESASETGTASTLQVAASSCGKKPPNAVSDVKEADENRDSVRDVERPRTSLHTAPSFRSLKISFLTHHKHAHTLSIYLSPSISFSFFLSFFFS